MNILDCIPTGHENGISRESLRSLMRMSDRKIRDLIAEANKSDDDSVLIINLQDGHGYFRPAPNEGNLVRLWKAQERARGNSVEESVDAAERYLSRGRKKAHKNDDLEKYQLSLFDLTAATK